MRLVLVSHDLCPYVQRIAISLAEKGAPFERVNIDLAAKPAWFNAISPLGKVPLLQVDAKVIFESAVILEYLEETIAPALHPQDPLQRADHRAWMEYGSVVLNDIAGLYNAPDKAGFHAKRLQIGRRFAWLEQRIIAAPWFDGADFGLVDAVFGPIFRYFDTFDALGVTDVIENLPTVRRWREALSARPSVRTAVARDYPARLRHFLAMRQSYLSHITAGIAVMPA